MVHIVVIIAVFGRILKQRADSLILLPGKIRLQCFPKLSRSHLPVLKHYLLDGCKAVRQVCNPHLKAADKVMDSAALRDSFLLTEAIRAARSA